MTTPPPGRHAPAGAMRRALIESCLTVLTAGALLASLVVGAVLSERPAPTPASPAACHPDIRLWHAAI
ncbi:hypothetical protein C9F11_08930 [Streptomyces sp. YIM 121038]|uniref:hypothetical protein n=1 Tax=Streptomyces sp. YIM 121038 TaxID=2136401 RepID=UPI001110E55D|nr:hypothetical protein [Streptomyces sp. YIM 121038]QCX75475.1 hypothetical protein C9F11_08930 [Streptomyces sp. YIM 121038]